jgi:tol-pal system protein YbgF
MVKKNKSAANKMNLVTAKTGGHILYYLSKKMLWVWAVLVIAFAGCASTEEVKHIKYDFLQQETKIKKIDERIKNLENFEQKETSSKQKDAVKRGQTEIIGRIDSLTQEIQQLNNRLDEVEMSVGTSQMGKGKSLHQRLATLEATAKSMGTSLPAPREEEIKDVDTEEPIPVKDAATVYLEANDAYAKGDTKEARRQFELILKEFPTSQQVESAQYWIGECYYKEEDYDNAILAFEELIRKNPESSKAPAALLKQGYSFYNIGERNIGKDVLEKLIKKFPNTEEAKLAKKRLEGTTE